MGEGRGVHRVLVGENEGRRSLGDPGVDGRIILRWIIRKWGGWGGGMDWNDLAQDRDRWQAVVHAVMKLQVAKNCGEFLDYLTTS
jgi:hypothetical protein